MTEEIWKEWVDENGKWKSNGVVKLHVEPSQKWIDEHPIIVPDPQPSDIELLRLEMARSNAEMFETMLALMGGV